MGGNTLHDSKIIMDYYGSDSVELMRMDKTAGKPYNKMERQPHPTHEF